VREAIADALVGCPPDGRVFAGPGGNGHALRHTYATWLEEAGIPSR
jgi:integrase